MEFINTTYGKAEVLFNDRDGINTFIEKIEYNDGYTYKLKYDDSDNLYALLWE